MFIKKNYSGGYRLFIAPNKLRELADKMEEKLNVIKPGDSTVVEQIKMVNYDNELVDFDICIDQKGLSKEG